MGMRSSCLVAIALALACPALAQEVSRPHFGTPVPAPAVFPSSPKATPATQEKAEITRHIASGQKEDTTKELDGAEPAVKPTIELRGRIQTDVLFVNQSQRNQEIFGDLQNAVGFRRARLGAQGTVGEQVYWVSEFDFAGGDIAFKDVLIGLDKLPLIRRVQIGHMLEPFSLEGYTSSNQITFMEGCRRS